MKNILAIVLLVYLTSVAMATGYLVGHNNGYEIGKRVGQVEALMQSSGSCFLHNGKRE
jgi:hypothetical protein